MPFANITSIHTTDNSTVFAIDIDDDVYRENIDRYVGEFKAKKTILVELKEQESNTDEEKTDEATVSRINLKR